MKLLLSSVHNHVIVPSVGICAPILNHPNPPILKLKLRSELSLKLKVQLHGNRKKKGEKHYMENAELLHPLVAEAVTRYNLEARVLACDPALADTAAFCEFYKFKPEQTCNAILAASKVEPIKFACCLILASCKLDVNKAVCRLLEIKKCSFASAEQTIQTTQMEIGGVTPVGVNGMPIYVDERVMNNELIVLGGGNRSSKLLLNPVELKKISGLEVVNSLAIPRG